MTPTFRIIADGTDITALLNDRLLLLSNTDKPGMESDDFELRIDDRNSAVSLPSRGASIEVFLGYSGTALSRLGRYTVDEVELSGPPDTLVIRGKASDMRGSGKNTRSGSWENVSLARIVNDLAARNGWQRVCQVAIVVPRADQLNESDFNFITRLAKQNDCTAKVADGKLLVMMRQAGQSASGKVLGAIILTRRDVNRWQFRLADRSTHKAVSTQHQDKKPASWPSSSWTTTKPRTACRLYTPTAISTPTNPPPNQRPRPGSPPSTVPQLRYAWKCPAAPTCLPNAVSTLKALKPVLMASTWWTRSSKSSPNAGPVAGVFVPLLNTAMVRYQIIGPKRVAAFIAQIGHESGQLKYVKEIWGPTAAQTKYEGRKDLGNTVAGDGSKYRGRGLIQITGRANYMTCGEGLSLDLIRQPELLEKPQHACMSAAWFWATRGLNTLADAVQFDRITRRINGGQNGAADRQALYARALKVLA